MIPLELFCAYFGFDPQHFYQLAGPKAPVESACATLVYEYAWQNAGVVGRSDIRAAIASANEKVRGYVGYSLTPMYRTITRPWTFPTVELPEGEIIALGSEVLTSLGTASVVLTDTDGDGIPDVFSAVFAVAAPEGGEYAAYFAAADRYDGSGIGERWEIAPITVATNPVTNQVAISGPAWLLVRPIQYQGRRRTAVDLDAANPAVYANTLELARRTTDATGAVSVAWLRTPLPTFCDSSGSLAISAEILDARRGVIRPTYGSCWPWAGHWREPDTITITYRAGHREALLSEAWRDVFMRFVAAEVARPICTCDKANQDLYEWQFDLARAGGKMDEQFQIAQSALECPFGTRRGHVVAWKAMRFYTLARGIAL